MSKFDLNGTYIGVV